MLSAAELKNKSVDSGTITPYYLDIPPQAISQKEVFSTNIQATRKGIIVESEGVIFKDIVIQGTTGIFPGPRGGNNSPQANSGDITSSGPKAPEGVDARKGFSRDTSTGITSGYEEFQGLRQYFLKYAYDKVKSDGDLFMIFINQKDNQTLIVEPLEFSMERSSKSPLTYNYKIVLKSIGTLAAIFTSQQSSNSLDLLTKIGNIAGNVAASVSQFRAAINLTSGLFQKTFQAIDQTVNGPLRQLQFALEDLQAGLSDTLSLPEILIRNTTDIINNIREAQSPSQTRPSIITNVDGQNLYLIGNIEAHISNDSRIAIPRSFVEETRDTLKSLSDNLADAFNLSDPLYNSINGRTVTENPGELKVVSDEEFLLLGNLQTVSDNINQVLATNDAFQSDSEKSFEQAKKAFEDPTLPENQQFINIAKPAQVKQVVIRRNDTLERIAARELGDALRWTELVIINKLKAYLGGTAGGDSVKKPGEQLLIPTK